MFRISYSLFSISLFHRYLPFYRIFILFLFLIGFVRLKHLIYFYFKGVYIFYHKKRFRSRCCSFLINRCFQFYLYRRLYYNPSQYLTCTINIIRKFEYLVNALSDMNKRCGLPQFWEKHACCMRFSVSWKCAEFPRVFLFLLTLLGRDWKEEIWISSRFPDNYFVGGKIFIDPTLSVGTTKYHVFYFIKV